MANTVDKVIKIAEAEVNYLEKKSNADLDSKTANAGYNNYTKYGRDMHKLYPAVMDFPAPWCDCFVDWCFQKAYGVTTAKSLLAGNFDDYTVASAQMYKNKNGWIPYNEIPQVGDQIFFVTSGKTREIKNICHTGLVYKVDKVYVYTIEGNTSSASGVVANGGAVAKKQYPLGYNRIAGYGRPKYDKETKVEEKTTTTKSTKKKYSGTFPELPKRGYFKVGDKGTDVKNLQKFLNWYGNYGLTVDGDLGAKTFDAVTKFQKSEKLLVDGEFGTKSLEAAKKVKK